MKEGMSICLVIMFIAFLGMEKASGLDEHIFAPSLSITEDVSTQSDDGIDMLCGIGLNVLLLFNTKLESPDSFFSNSTALMIEPTVSAEYSFFSNLLRIRAGAHFGQFFNAGIFAFFGYYAGFSGIVINDFENTAAAVGIAPEIGIELYFFLIGFRLQLQYDFYTIERYNRFVFTTSLTVMLPHL